MTLADRERAATMLRRLRQDIHADVSGMEGAPFTGHVVSVALGHLAAQVDALAGVLQLLVGDEPGGRTT